MANLNRSQSNGFALSCLVNKGTDFYKMNYKCNGTGRDNYIQSNNGGLQPQYYSPSKQLSDGTRQLYVGNSQHGCRNNLNPEVNGKKINYELDGTGRDTYIFDINGGFYPQKTVAVYAQNYQNQLRIGHRKNPTEFYMARRNSRMKKFNRNRISRIENIVNDTSLENMDRRATLINTIRQGSKNTVLKVNDGWVTNKNYNAQRSQKELY